MSNNYVARSQNSNLRPMPRDNNTQHKVIYDYPKTIAMPRSKTAKINKKLTSKRLKSGVPD